MVEVVLAYCSSEGREVEQQRLTERVDSPNATLNEDLVFVHDDEGSESLRSQLLEEYRVGGSVSFEDL